MQEKSQERRYNHRGITGYVGGRRVFSSTSTITTLSLSNHTHYLNHKSPFCNLNTPLRIFFAEISHSLPWDVPLASQPQVCLMSFILIPSLLLNCSVNHKSARIVYPSCSIPFHVHCSNHKLATLSFPLICLYKGLSSSSSFPSSSAEYNWSPSKYHLAPAGIHPGELL